MPANTTPIFPLVPNIDNVALTTSDTSLTVPAGTILITGGTNGTRIDAIKVHALGTNVASLLRVFYNDGLGVLAANFALVHEVSLPVSTASVVAPTAADIVLMPLNFDGNGGGVLPPYLKAGQKLYVSLGTTVVAGWEVVCFGGDY